MMNLIFKGLNSFRVYMLNMELYFLNNVTSPKIVLSYVLEICLFISSKDRSNLLGILSLIFGSSGFN